MSEFDALRWAEEQSERNARRVKALLWEQGRPDLATELDAKLRDIRLGIDGARSTWHSISDAQRRVLTILGTGRHLIRGTGKARYDATGTPYTVVNVCRLATARALCAHDLLAPDGGAFDPEGKFVLTERARFVLAQATRD